VIVAAADRTLRPEWLRQAARQRLGRQPVEVSAGHCPHVSQPEAIADILVRA
jgi:pimeloyl-ACP methyl ester carboxylesterase